MFDRLDFGSRWKLWMEACVFETSFSVLANSSPTKDFVGLKGIRQGDPISIFLFAVIGERLTGLVSKAKLSGLFKGISCDDNCEFNILQFVDDTILMGERSWHNLWALKAIFRGFKLVSGLKVNFGKIKNYGLNTTYSFLEAGADFLSCCSDKIPFKFMGVVASSNPMRVASWK